MTVYESVTVIAETVGPATLPPPRKSSQSGDFGNDAAFFAGAIIGGVIGYAILGTFGAIVGGAIGAVIATPNG